MWDLLAADGLGYNCDFYCLKSRICRKGTQFIVIFWLLYKKMKVHEANCIRRRDERNFGKKSNKSRWGWLSESFEVMRVAMAAKNDVTRSSVNRGPFTWYESTANFELFGVKPGNCKCRKKRTHSRRAVQLIFRKIDFRQFCGAESDVFHVFRFCPRMFMCPLRMEVLRWKSVFVVNKTIVDI